MQCLILRDEPVVKRMFERLERVQTRRIRLHVVIAVVNTGNEVGSAAI